MLHVFNFCSLWQLGKFLKNENLSNYSNSCEVLKGYPELKYFIKTHTRMQKGNKICFTIIQGNNGNITERIFCHKLNSDVLITQETPTAHSCPHSSPKGCMVHISISYMQTRPEW